MANSLQATASQPHFFGAMPLNYTTTSSRQKRIERVKQYTISCITAFKVHKLCCVRLG